MYRRYGILVCLAVLVLIGIHAGTIAQQGAGKNGDDPDQTMAAWKRLGIVDWLEKTKFGWLISVPTPPGDQPPLRCFSIIRMPEDGLKKMPIPKGPFGIVFFRNDNVTDATLKELADFKQLTALSLHAARVTDAGLKALAGHKHLESLQLYNMKLSDAAMKEVAAIPNLKWLQLNWNRISDRGLEELTKLKQLQKLYL